VHDHDSGDDCDDCVAAVAAADDDSVCGYDIRSIIIIVNIINASA
jgi:hypothetical protein